MNEENKIRYQQKTNKGHLKNIIKNECINMKYTKWENKILEMEASR